jgi:hypothetical protein
MERDRIPEAGESSSGRAYEDKVAAAAATTVRPGATKSQFNKSLDYWIKIKPAAEKKISTISCVKFRRLKKQKDPAHLLSI